MNLTFDFTELFQNSRIEEAAANAQVAWTSASNNGRQISPLATTVEQRIQEVEAENAILGLLVVRLLQALAEKDAPLVEKVLDDVRNQMNSAPVSPRGLDFLRQALELPVKRRTPISDYARPKTAKRPTAPKPRAPGA